MDPEAEADVALLEPGAEVFEDGIDVFRALLGLALAKEADVST